MCWGETPKCRKILARALVIRPLLITFHPYEKWARDGEKSRGSSLKKDYVMATESGALSFTRDIRPLFRESDRDSMLFGFDLWDYLDVCTHAQEILERLADGTMPCDGEWPELHISQFRRWVEAGMPA
jgi:hypothetical protein